MQLPAVQDIQSPKLFSSDNNMDPWSVPVQQQMHDQINCKKSPTGSLPPAVPLAITRTFRPWTHTSDDSYIYQLSLVVGTATVSFLLLRFFVFFFILLHVCCTACRLTARTDRGAQQRFYSTPGVIFFQPSGFSLLCSSFDFSRVQYLFASLLLICLPIHTVHFLWFVCFHIIFITLNFVDDRVVTISS